MVNQQKKDLVSRIAHLISEAPVVGILDMMNLPAQQLQKIRGALRNEGIDMIMTRKRLFYLALKQSGKDKAEELGQKIRGMPALIFSKGNPFALYSFLQKSKSAAAAKPGQLAPRDLIAKAGPTPFAPGPIISELASVGIKTKVDAGKLVIINDSILVKEGQVISTTN